MNESRPSSCPKIFISNELETSPFFYPIVNQAFYQTGIAEIRCLYAPEFAAHSASLPVEVK